jgi:hypothetical protein
MDGLLPVFPIVSMPKGSVDKNHQPVFDQGDVRFAGKVSFVAAVPDACMPKCFFEELFRFGVLTPDLGHVVRPLLGGIEAVFLTEFGYGYFW